MLLKLDLAGGRHVDFVDPGLQVDFVRCVVSTADSGGE